MYLYFIVGILVGIFTLWFMSKVYDYRETKHLLMFIIPNIILWPICFIIGIYAYVKAKKKDKMIYNMYDTLNNWCEEMKDEERD